jgi:hypothetical protein
VTEHEHYIIRCRACDAVITECRCAGLLMNKNVLYDLCVTCKPAQPDLFPGERLHDPNR